MTTITSLPSVGRFLVPCMTRSSVIACTPWNASQMEPKQSWAKAIKAWPLKWRR